MQNFVNNWSMPVELAAGAETLALTLPAGSYRITLADAAGASATRWEVVGAVVAGGVATLQRGLEGTTDQTWPEGSVAYVTITAGFLEELQQSMAAQHAYRGVGSPVGAVVAPVSSHYIDEEAGEIWFCVFSDGTESDWRRMAVDNDVINASGSTATVTIGNPLPINILLAPGTTVQFTFAGPIYSNVALSGELLSFTTASLCSMSLRRVDGGGVTLTVTPLTEYN